MRPTLVASLLLSPILCAASAVAVPPAPSQPEILSKTQIHIPAEALGVYVGSEGKVVLSLYVDDKGNAQSVRVVQSVNPTVDAYVVNGVLQSHFRPAVLNNRPVGAQMNLSVLVQR